MRRVAAAGTAAAILVAGCSSGDGRPPPAEAAEARELVVRALAWRPEESAGTARVARTVVQEAPGVRTVTSRSDGVVDYRHNRFLGRQTLADQPTKEVFVAGRFQYERPPDGTWDKSPRKGREVDDPVPSPLLGRRRESGAPREVPPEAERRAIADALLADVVTGGTSKQHGIVTRRYRLMLDPDRAKRQLEPRLAEVRTRWTAIPEEMLEVHLWIDTEGRVRKLSWPFLTSPDSPGALRLEEEWWDLGGPGEVSLPDDLGDPTVIGGEGRTSLTVTGGTVGRLELEDGEKGTFVDDVHVSDYRVDVSEGDAGQPRYFWTFRFEVPEAGVRPPAIVPAQVSRTTSVEQSTSIVPANVVPCDRPETTATVRELVLDPDGRFVRFRATFTLSCPTGPRAEGDLRFHALT